jgi:iron(III) transport system substrate-binding protein
MQALRPRRGVAAGRHRRRGGARLIFAVLLAAAVSVAAAQSSAELVDAARKEGSVNVYTSNAAPTIQALVADFEKRYGVKVNLWRASSIKVLQRLAAEKQANRWEFDAVSVSGLEIEALYREGLLQEIRSPLHADMLEGTLPAHRGWAPQFINVFVQAYNTNLVRKQDLPKRWTDLLDPRWRGKLGAEAASGEWYCTLVKSVNAELLRTIAARNGLSVHPGNSVLANMVISGEVSLALSAYTHIVYEAKDRGAPIDALIVEPLIGRVNGVGVSRKPPHPSAARLFYEYNIGESQPLMVKLHYFSPLKKFPSPLGAAKMVFVDLSMDSAEVARCDSAYDSLMRIKK